MPPIDRLVWWDRRATRPMPRPYSVLLNGPPRSPVRQPPDSTLMTNGPMALNESPSADNQRRGPELGAWIFLPIRQLAKELFQFTITNALRPNTSDVERPTLRIRSAALVHLILVNYGTIPARSFCGTEALRKHLSNDFKRLIQIIIWVDQAYVTQSSNAQSGEETHHTSDA